MPFRFRHFVVEDELSTIRVGTDAMLLGAWTNPGKAARILDIGTGCGILALMMAQKSVGPVDALEIDHLSAQQASVNFRNSPWAARLTIHAVSLQEFIQRPFAPYDLSITNPPFFAGSLKSPSARKNTARHDGALSLDELAAAAARLLAPEGKLAIVLPDGADRRFTLLCAGHALFPEQKMQVYPKPGAHPKRILSLYGRSRPDKVILSSLTILGPDGNYSAEYLKLTADFHDF